MATKDPRIDAYIARSAAFAQPILKHLRKVVHAGCPNVVETMKWSMPHFDHKGVMCGMAAFKEYCAFHFWKGALIIEGASGDQMWGQLGRLSKVSDLPSKKVLVGYIKKAMVLNADGTKVPRPPAKPKKELVMPESFMAAIKKNKKALAGYEAFSPSAKREYVEWITDAKGEDTRARRIAQAVEWMAEGKPRNWKYM
jgi:uncharacterized protein YdeI (YjbR/CyaY-like superfamily)